MRVTIFCRHALYPVLGRCFWFLVLAFCRRPEYRQPRKMYVPSEQGKKRCGVRPMLQWRLFSLHVTSRRPEFVLIIQIYQVRYIKPHVHPGIPGWTWGWIWWSLTTHQAKTVTRAAYLTLSCWYGWKIGETRHGCRSRNIEVILQEQKLREYINISEATNDKLYSHVRIFRSATPSATVPRRPSRYLDGRLGTVALGVLWLYWQ